MRRLPILPTLLVSIAAVIMVLLGIWQLQRAQEKEALLVQLAANGKLKAEIIFPRMAPLPDDALFRQSSVMCLEPISWTRIGGRAKDGSSGFRHIAACREGAEGPGVLIDMGVAGNPSTTPEWRGGMVSGVITRAPSADSVLTRMFGRAAPTRPMLVSATGATGLKPSAPPSLDDVPNNHRAYAVQWFIFAAIALGIYALAMRRRKAAG